MVSMSVDNRVKKTLYEEPVVGLLEQITGLALTIGWTERKAEPMPEGQLALVGLGYMLVGPYGYLHLDEVMTPEAIAPLERHVEWMVDYLNRDHDLPNASNLAMLILRIEGTGYERRPLNAHGSRDRRR